VKLFLHIGTEKTGTTSIQNWGALNRDRLGAQGIFYSRALGGTNHTKIYLHALGPESGDPGFAAAGAKTPEARVLLVAAVPEALAAEVQEARRLGCDRFVISNEHCHSRLTKFPAIDRLRALVTGLFDEIEIVAFLRPQIDMAVSAASTVVRAGFPLRPGFFDTVTPEAPYYDLLGLYRRWTKAFGDGAVRLVPFGAGDDVVSDFALWIGADPAGFRTPGRMNEALDIGVMALANALHEARQGGATELPPLPFDVFTCRERLQPGAENARAVQARFAADNERLAALQADVTADDLVPDWSRYDAPQNLAKLDRIRPFAATIVELLAELDRRRRGSVREEAAGPRRRRRRVRPEPERPDASGPRS
jgi:hypothetical protein